jgi:exosortase D (VPLPA-CTERM-specific)
MQRSRNLQSVWIFSAFYLAVLVGLYYSSFSWMIGRDWNKDDYTYCYLMPFIILYILWEKRDKLAALPSSPAWTGLVVLGFGITFYWLGELGGEFYSMYLSFWLVIIGLCWLHLGWRKMRVIVFPLFLILTLFPPPNFIYNKISVQLKLISSEIGVSMMQTYGLSAYREGNVIDLGFTQLQVIDACSGLRYLIPLIVMGLLFAYFYRAPFWKKAVLVLSTIPLSILTNGLRIASVGILYQYWGPMVAEGFFHDFSGWFIFMASLGLLLGEMGVLKAFGKRKPNAVQGSGFKVQGNKGKVQGDKDEARGLGFKVHGKNIKIIKDQQSTINNPHSLFPGLPQFIVAIVLLGSTLAIGQTVEFREKVPSSRPFAEFPLQVGTWSGSRETMEQQFIDELDLSDYVIIDYHNGNKPINFYVAYYESQRKGESIHSPATCLPGSGWIFNQAGTITLPFASGNGTPMHVNRAYMQKGSYNQLVYYWFPQRGRILTNAYQLKLFAFWDALTRQRTDGALAWVITPVFEDERLADADARLQGFVKLIEPVLEEFIPN